MLDFEGLKKAATARRFLDFKTSIGVARIRSLTERERSAYEMSFTGKNGKPDRDAVSKLRARFISLCLVDANDELIVHDHNELVDLDSKVIAELYRACADHCGIEQDAVEEIEELEKNSGGTPAE